MHSYEAPEEIADTNAVRNVEYSWLELAAHQANLVRKLATAQMLGSP